jgi:hypothetical protein
MLCFKEVIETNDFFFPFVTLKLLVTALCTIRNAMSKDTEEFSAYLCTQLIFSNIYTSIVCGVFSTMRNPIEVSFCWMSRYADYL